MASPSPSPVARVQLRSCTEPIVSYANANARGILDSLSILPGLSLPIEGLGFGTTVSIAGAGSEHLWRKKARSDGGRRLCGASLRPELAKTDTVHVTLIDRNNFHQFRRVAARPSAM
jgi:hypothetical protein